MVSFVAFLAFMAHILDIPNHDGEEEPAPSPTGELPLPSPPAGSSPPLDTLPPPPPPPTGSTASSQPHLQRRQRSSPFLNVAPPRRGMDIGDHVPDSHQMDTLSWTALGYCFTAGLEFNAILAQAEDRSNVTIRVQFLSLLLGIALYLLIAANGIFARTHPSTAYVMDRVGTLIVLISSTIAAMPTAPEYVSVGCVIVMIILYAHQYFFSS